MEIHLTFSPMRLDETLEVARAGDSLILNGRVLDLSGTGVPARAEGDCPWLAGDVIREAGRCHVPLILPHGLPAPHGTLFPEPVVVTRDGPVEIPPHTGPETRPGKRTGERAGQEIGQEIGDPAR